MYDAALRTDPCLNVSMLAQEAEGAAAAFATNITACAEASGALLAVVLLAVVLLESRRRC